MFRSVTDLVHHASRPLKRRRFNDTPTNVAIESLEPRQLLTAVLTELGTDYVAPFSPIEFNGRLFYAGNDAPRGYQLLSSGPDGTEVIHDMAFGVAPFEVNGSLLFAAESGSSGVELFRTDGTAIGTVMVKNINLQSSAADSIAEVDWTQAVVFKDQLFFVANDGIHGEELWVSDGTTAGTMMLQDIKIEGSGNSVVNTMTVSGDSLYFLANDLVHGHELWKTDGTKAGTTLVQDFTAGSQSTIINILRATDDGGLLLNARAVGTSRSEFSLIEIKADGTHETIQTNGAILDAYKFKGDVYLTYEGTAESIGNGGILVKRNGTVEIETFWTNTSYGGGFSRGGGFYGEVNGRLVFSFRSKQNNPRDYSLMSTDGSEVETLARIYHQQDRSVIRKPSVNHVELNGEWYFRSWYGEVLATDGTAANSRIIKELNGTSSANPIGFGVFADRVWFVAYHTEPARGRYLFSTDGTEEGTIQETPHKGYDGLTITGLGPVVSLSGKSNDRRLYLLTDSVLAEGPTITTPQTEISGPMEWEAVAGADHYEVYESFVPTPPIDNEQIVRVDSPFYTPQNWGQTFVLVRSVSSGAKSEWSTAVFYSKTVPRFNLPEHMLHEGYSANYSNSRFRNRLDIQTDSMFTELPRNKYGQFTGYNGRTVMQVFHNGKRVDPTATLVPGQYRVRAKATGERNGVGTVTSEWSSFKTIHILADRIKLITPFESQESTRPTFRWTRYYGDDFHINDGANYTIRVDNETTGQNNVLLVKGITDLNYTPDIDLPAGHYRAWVQANDFNSEKDWSEEIRFSIGMEVTGLGPAGQASTNQPTITWNALDVPNVEYEVWVNEHEGQKKIVHATGITGSQYQVSQTLDDGLYRVFVRGHFPNGETTGWSETAEFTVGASVVPMIPGPGGSVSDTTPTISWEGTASSTHYRLHIRNLTTKENLAIDQDNITTTDYTLTEELADGQYAIWVRGYAAGQPVTVWSPPKHFYIGDTPMLTGPGEYVDAPGFSNENEYNADFIWTPVDFSWTAIDGATGYEFRLSHLQAGAKAMHATNIQGTSISTDYALPTGTYRGWVRALKADGTATRWSHAVEFTVADTNAEDDSETTDRLALGDVQMAMLTPPVVDSADYTEAPANSSHETSAPPTPARSVMPPVQTEDTKIAAQTAGDPETLIDKTFRDLPFEELDI